MKLLSYKLLFTVVCFPSTVSASLIFYSTSNYHGRSDNPIINNTSAQIVYVEDFENQGYLDHTTLSTPNASGWNGLNSGSPFWGVQEDYRESDSDGGLGFRWTDSGHSSSSTKLPDGIHFDFTPNQQGRLPEYAGAALRGFGLLGNGPSFNVILVYDRDGLEVTDGQWQIPKPIIDPDQPIEDLFLNFEGIYVPGGISRILFRDFTEVDHLTYGYTIPEPGAASLAAGAYLFFLGRRRKHQSGTS